MFVGHPILDEIRQGCRLRPTRTIDKSNPIILVEGESLNPMLSQRREPSPSAPMPPPLPTVDARPPPLTGVPPLPPLLKKQRNLKPVTNPALLKLGGKTEVNRDELMKAIRGGVRLRKVTTNDKSGPIIEDYEGMTRSRSSRGSSPLGNEYQSDDAYESAQSSLSPLSTSPDLQSYRSESSGFQQNAQQRNEESHTVIAKPQSTCFHEEPRYAIPTIAEPPPPPPPPPPSLSNCAPPPSTLTDSMPGHQDIFKINVTSVNGTETATDATLEKPKKADEHYTSPIPTREMIEAEIPTGSAANRIKLLNSMHNRTQSQSPVRQLHRPVIQRNMQPTDPPPPQLQETAQNASENVTRPSGFPGGRFANRSFSDVNSIKIMAQRFDNNPSSTTESNVNDSDGVYKLPMKVSVSNGNLQSTLTTDPSAKFIPSRNDIQKQIPGKWTPPPRCFIGSKLQQPPPTTQDARTYKPMQREPSLPKSPEEEPASNSANIPPKPQPSKTASQRWPPEQPSSQKILNTASKVFMRNANQSTETTNDSSKNVTTNEQSQRSHGNSVAFLKSQLAQAGVDSQRVASTVQRSPPPLQRPTQPSAHSSPIQPVTFSTRSLSQSQPAPLLTATSSFERVSPPVPSNSESGSIRRAASPTQLPSFRTASPVPHTARCTPAQRSDSSSSSAQYAQVHQVAPPSHTAHNTPIQRVYASTHEAPDADMVASNKDSPVYVEPFSLNAPIPDSSLSTSSQTSLRSTDLSILPTPTIATSNSNSHNVSPRYTSPIQVNTDELPPPIPNSEPPNAPHSPVHFSSRSSGSEEIHHQSPTKTGTGPYRYVKQQNQGASSYSAYSTLSSQSLVSPTNTAQSNASSAELSVSSAYSPNSASSISPSTSVSGGSLRSSNPNFENSLGSIGPRQTPVGASDEEQRSEAVISEPVYSQPIPRTIFIRNVGARPASPLEQTQYDNSERRQWTTISNDQSNPRLESLKAQRIDSKTYSIPINAPWYTSQVGKAEPAASDAAHFAGARSNDPLSHQGVGRAHRIIIGVNDPIQQRFANENPETLRSSFKFAIDLESDEPLRIVQS
uniref:WH2 domain-containing protein n=1 Tax=Parascaris univalens TaxID=6257 RepID=A0A915B3H6_PARUN